MDTEMQGSTNPQLDTLLNICIALTSRPSTSSVLRELMGAVKQATNADGGTLYLLNSDGTKLRAVLVRNDTLKIETDQDAPEVMKSLQIPLLTDVGENSRNLVAHAVNNKKLINIADRSTETGFDFSGANSFDQRFGYQSKSFLILPLTNAEGRCLGAIQLINARNSEGSVGSFDAQDAQYSQGIAALAATALTNRNTMQDLEQLFEYFAELLALLNDHMSAGESSEGSKALLMSLSLAKAMHNSSDAELSHFKLNETVLREIKIAGWLRSWALQYRNAQRAALACGTTVHRLITQRIEIIRRDLKLDYYERLHEGDAPETATRRYHESLQQLDREWQRIDSSLSHKALTQKELEKFGSEYHWRLSGENLPLISADEAAGLLRETSSTSRSADQPDATRSIIDILSTLRLPSYLGQALSLANLNSLLDDASETAPRIFDPVGQLIYDLLRVTEQFSTLLSEAKDKSETTVQQVLRLLSNDSNMNQTLVELLIKQRLYQPFV